MDRGFLAMTGVASALTFGGVLLLTAPSASQSPGAATIAPSYAYYPNCDTARAAGAAPVYRGQPGYRPELDADDDGIACEPHRIHLGIHVPHRVRIR
ncbi:excalibur calcium-binding domain-containing protein [Sphingomonas oligophenolica]|uniref:Excalibur calcium-binding domain-containing protein n=1 Tax=Sphingomonas oligophenolica TaxID=301154 RepID=A0ABU9Y8K2_9SPHN